jgi:hypothetical protein
MTGYISTGSRAQCDATQLIPAHGSNPAGAARRMVLRVRALRMANGFRFLSEEERI